MVRSPARADESMGPPHRRMAQNPSACPAYLLVQVALLAAEAAEPRVEARPGPTAAGKHPEPLHPDLEWFPAGIGDAVVEPPLPVHARAPDRIEVTRGRSLEPVVQHRALDHVHAVGVLVET